MHTYRLAIIGFGNVGQGFVSILRDRRDELARRYGALFQVVAVSDMLKGSVYEPDGRLTYSGKVGTGFNSASLATVHRALLPLVQKEPPFHNPPRGAEAR